MKVLIELYDKEKPINNYVTGLAMKPDKIVCLGEKTIWQESRRARLERVFGEFCPDTELALRSHKPAHMDAVLGDISRVLDQYGAENCVIDVTGGSELMLIAAGRLYEKYRTPIVAYRPTTHSFVQLAGDEDIGVAELETPRITVQQSLAMCGRELMFNGHGMALRDSPEAMERIETLFDICRSNHAEWAQFVYYFQQINKPPYRVSPTFFAVPRVIRNAQAQVSCPAAILFRLCDEGFIHDLAMNSTDIQFSLTQSVMADCLSDVGLVLELYIYKALNKCGLFDDVDLSDVICWDDDGLPDNNIVNEIDVIAQAGIGQLFISCKSGAVDTSALNEVFALSRRFGNGYATPVLVTLRDMAADNPSLAMRAQTMGVTLIGGALLEMDALMERFGNMARLWK